MISFNGKFYALFDEFKTIKEVPGQLKEVGVSEFITKLKHYRPTVVYYYNPGHGSFYHWVATSTRDLLLEIIRSYSLESGHFYTPWSEVFLFPDGIFVFYQSDGYSLITSYNTYQEFVEISTSPRIYEELCKNAEEFENFIFGERSKP